jgi:hypothetical protein
MSTVVRREGLDGGLGVSHDSLITTQMRGAGAAAHDGGLGVRGLPYREFGVPQLFDKSNLERTNTWQQ